MHVLFIQRCIDGLHGRQGGRAELSTTHWIDLGLAGGQLGLYAGQPELGIGDLGSGR
jgi:hypothetical protein